MSKVETCFGVKSHTPEPAEVDRHHIFPKYLSHLLGVPERRETAALCSGCHDLVHHVLRHFINEGTMGRHRLSSTLRTIVDRAWEWWQSSLLSIGE